MKLRLLARAVVCAYLAAAGTARAQTAESVAAVTGEYYPSTKGPNARQQIGVDLFRVTASYPLVLEPKAPKWILLPGLAYERLEFRTRGIPLAPDILHAPLLSFGVLRVVTPKILALASVSTGFATDFGRGVQAKDLVVTGMALVMYRPNSTFSIGAGIGYDRRTGSFNPLPALPLQWRVSPRVRLRGVVPAFLAAEYRTAPWLTSGVRAAFDGNRYHLSDARYRAHDLQLAYSVISIGPRLTFHLTKLVNLDLYANMPVFRRYASYANDEKTSSTYLAPVVGYGVRLWVGLSSWDPPAKRK